MLINMEKLFDIWVLMPIFIYFIVTILMVAIICRIVLELLDSSSWLHVKIKNVFTILHSQKSKHPRLIDV